MGENAHRFQIVFIIYFMVYVFVRFVYILLKSYHMHDFNFLTRVNPEFKW